MGNNRLGKGSGEERRVGYSFVYFLFTFFFKGMKGCSMGVMPIIGFLAILQRSLVTRIPGGLSSDLF